MKVVEVPRRGLGAPQAVPSRGWSPRSASPRAPAPPRRTSSRSTEHRRSARGARHTVGDHAPLESPWLELSSSQPPRCAACRWSSPALRGFLRISARVVVEGRGAPLLPSLPPRPAKAAERARPRPRARSARAVPRLRPRARSAPAAPRSHPRRRAQACRQRLRRPSVRRARAGAPASLPKPRFAMPSSAPRPATSSARGQPATATATPACANRRRSPGLPGAARRSSTAPASPAHIPPVGAVDCTHIGELTRLPGCVPLVSLATVPEPSSS